MPQKFSRLQYLFVLTISRLLGHPDDLERAEATPVCFALMAQKSQAIYTTLFTQLRDTIILEFGDLGNLQRARWNFDYEVSAFAACRHVFPDCTTSGCMFHYPQAIIGAKDIRGTYHSSELSLHCNL